MLIEFYGQECGHCMTMKPLVERLEKEFNVTFEKLETWHNEENQKKFEELAADKCMGVPFFINTDTGAYVCGEDSYDALKKLVQ